PGAYLVQGRAGPGRPRHRRRGGARPPGAAARGRTPRGRLSKPVGRTGEPAVRRPGTGRGSPMTRIALLTYSTKPRGGVVHTLALAEALARAGASVTVWTLGRGGDTGFFRPGDPAVLVRVVPFPEVEGEHVGARILRSVEVLRAAFEPRAYDVVHAQDCISANAVGRCVRTIHHLDTFTTPELAACHERAVVEPYARICV